MEVNSMVHNWENLDHQKAAIGLSGWLWYLCFFLAIIFAVVGVIGDAASAKLGLTPCSWFLLAVVASVIGVYFAISWVVEWHLKIAA
jgi:hypothetical protein